MSLEPTKIYALVVPAILIPFGTLGNLSAILTLWLGKVPSRPVNILLIAVAMSDIICLNSGYLSTWIEDVNNYEDSINTTIRMTALKPENLFSPFLFASFATYSAFLVCAISIERFIAVWKVFQVNHIITKKSTWIVTGFLLALSLGLYLPLFFTDNVKYVDTRKGVVDVFGGTIMRNISLGTCVVPLLIIFPVNLGTCLMLHRRRCEILKSGLGKSDTKDNFRLSFVLILSSISHISFPVPSRICNIINNFHMTMATNPDFYVVTYHMCKINFAINWIYYFFITSTMRNEFIDIFKTRPLSAFNSTRLSILNSGTASK